MHSREKVAERLATNLKKYRTERGLKQSQVAKSIGIDRSTYSYYETGHSLPSVVRLIDISEFFDVSINKLVL
jgi:transcriptional regulator with XRE-family HTH domain